jgi:hypothetical protein
VLPCNEKFRNKDWSCENFRIIKCKVCMLMEIFNKFHGINSNVKSDTVYFGSYQDFRRKLSTEISGLTLESAVSSWIFRWFFTRINGVTSQETNVHLSVLYQYTHKTVKHSTPWVITRHSLTELMSIIYKHRYSAILLRPLRSGSVKWNVVRWFSGQMVHFNLLSSQSLRNSVNRYISPHLYLNMRQTFRMTVN